MLSGTFYMKHQVSNLLQFIECHLKNKDGLDFQFIAVLKSLHRLVEGFQRQWKPCLAG